MPKFYCFKCSQHINAHERLAGTMTTCPSCQIRLWVPEDSIATTATLAPNPFSPPNSQNDYLEAEPLKPTPPLRATETKSGSGSTGLITKVVSVIAVVVLARACGGNFGRNLAEERIAERERENAYIEAPTNTVEDALGQFVRLASTGLPKMVDGITRLDSVTLQNGNTIVEAYTVTTLAKNELDVPGITSDLNRKIKSEFKSDPKTKIMRDNNVVWVWKYYDRNGELISTVSSSS